MDAIKIFFTEPDSSYQRTFRFYSIFLFLAIIASISKVWGTGTQGIFVILVIVFALYLVNNFVDNSQTELSDFNSEIYIKLQELQAKVNDHIEYKVKLTNISGMQLPKQDHQRLMDINRLDSLYIDASLIQFLHSIITLYEYNPDEYYMLVKGTNNILKIRKQIEEYYNSNSVSETVPSESASYVAQKNSELVSFRDHPKPRQEPVYTENLAEMFEIAINLKANCVNNLQNMIYKVPKTNKLYDYIDTCIDRYIILINRNLQTISDYHLNAIRDTGINTRTKFVYFKGTKPFDALRDQNVVLNKSLEQRNSLYDLYV